MNFKLFLSLFVIVGILFFSSCGNEEQKPELQEVESVDDLVQEPEQVNTDTVKVDSVAPAVTKIEAKEKLPETGGQTETPAVVSAAGDYSKKPLQGTVVSFNDLVTGGTGKVNKATAQDLVSKGNLIVLQATDGNLYFVYNEDGTFAGKRLAGYANNEKVGLLGKSKVVDGIHVFIMNLIEAM